MSSEDHKKAKISEKNRKAAEKFGQKENKEKKTSKRQEQHFMHIYIYNRSIVTASCVSD